ncbi:MAG: hypothetical protein KDE48_05815 [Anaerolineales bacterium]|nr:hypothetical protein [Anaerolineales bacterium]
MNQLDNIVFENDFEQGMTQSAMERMLLEEYLRTKGNCLADMDALPTEQAKTLMKAACQYASLKMAHVESTVHFRDKIRSAV